MGTQREVYVSRAPSHERALLALEMGMSTTDGIHPGLTHVLPPGCWGLGAAPEGQPHLC